MYVSMGRKYLLLQQKLNSYYTSKGGKHPDRQFPGQGSVVLHKYDSKMQHYVELTLTRQTGQPLKHSQFALFYKHDVLQSRLKQLLLRIKLKRNSMIYTVRPFSINSCFRPFALREKIQMDFAVQNAQYMGLQLLEITKFLTGKINTDDAAQ